MVGHNLENLLKSLILVTVIWLITTKFLPRVVEDHGKTISVVEDTIRIGIRRRESHDRFGIK